MWVDVEAQLVKLLGAAVYPKLLSDAGYQVLLERAQLAKLPGVKNGVMQPGAKFAAVQDGWGASKAAAKPWMPGVKGELTPEQQKGLYEAARLTAQLMRMYVDGQECLKERGAKAQLLEGKGLIYRVWDSKSNNQTRHWWFSQALKNEAEKEAPKQNISVQDWIRDALAISLDFGKCDRISQISLEDLGGVPAIVAEGLPMPQRMVLNRDKSAVPVEKLDTDYWERVGKVYRGQKTQYFLPFVPPDFIRSSAWG